MIVVIIYVIKTTIAVCLLSQGHNIKAKTKASTLKTKTKAKAWTFEITAIGHETKAYTAGANYDVH